MRKIVAGLFISLDGVVEAPETWHFPYFNDEMGEVVGGLMGQSDTMLLGRKTYQGFAEYWPNADEAEGAAHMNAIPKLVASTTLTSVEWQNSTLIEGNVAESLTKLKQGPGGTIGITGSVALVRSLLHDNVLDELTLLVHPIIVGSGMRLFDDMNEQIPLTLTESRTLGTGVVILTYTRAAQG